MNFSHYLPDTAKRLVMFKNQVVNGRPVAIVLPGFSVYELEERIEEFRDFDICYASINEWRLLEQDILNKIDKRVCILFNGAGPDWYIDDECSYLERPDDNIFITERLNFKENDGENLNRLYSKYNKKLLIFTSFYASGIERPCEDFPLHIMRENSLSILTALITIAEPSAIIYFGADGGRITDEGLYHKNINDFIHPDGLLPELSLMRDTRWFNRNMKVTLGYTAKTHKVKIPEIINCSEKSYLDLFPKFSYTKTIEYLRRIC